jgi:uncharacterized protein (DUF58 family)
MALHNNDRVSIDRFAHTVERTQEACHGRGRVFPFLHTLQETGTFGHDSDFASCAKAFQLRARKRGLVVVISDFLFPDGADAAFKLLQWHGHDVFCIQVQDEADRRCELRGDCELDCVETGRRLRVTVTPELARRYEQKIEALNEDLRLACARRGVGLISTTSEVPFDDIIQRILRRGGLVA